MIKVFSGLVQKSFYWKRIRKTVTFLSRIYDYLWAKVYHFPDRPSLSACCPCLATSEKCIKYFKVSKSRNTRPRSTVLPKNTKYCLFFCESNSPHNQAEPTADLGDVSQHNCSHWSNHNNAIGPLLNMAWSLQLATDGRRGDSFRSSGSCFGRLFMFRQIWMILKPKHWKTFLICSHPLTPWTRTHQKILWKGKT